MHANPYTDWSAHLFTAERVQYVLITNTISLYSRVIFGRGITDAGAFLERAISSLSELLENDGFRFIRDRVFIPYASSFSFSKALNRSVIGSMNELVMYAQTILISEEISPYDLSFILNDMRLSKIEYGTPHQAFEKMELEP